jgi:collagen beta-1,O-galactosyltransferase
LKVKAFVLNLKRRKDRKKHVLAQLPEFFETYFTSDWDGPMDGQSLTDETLQKHGFALFPWKLKSKNRWWNRPMTKGEIGCSISHWLCWKKAATFNDPHYVFLEDDVRLGPTFGEDLPGTVARLSALDEAWDLLFLGRCPQEADEGRVGEFIKPGFSYGTHAYMLSHAGIAKLLTTGFPADLIPADEFLPAMYCDHPRADVRSRYPKRLRAYSVDPLLCSVEHQLGSDIVDSGSIP